VTIADSVWLATALLHRENSLASDFSVQEIIEKSLAARLVENYRPGLSVYCSKHCVANKSPNPVRDRILLETSRGRRRLFRTGDPFHPGRQNGKVRPDKKDLPPEYQSLVDWYETDYLKHASQPRMEPPSNMYSREPFVEHQPSVAFIGPAGSVVIPAGLRRDLGIEEGSRISIRKEKDRIVLQPVTDELISKTRGSCKGGDSMVEAREREHRNDRY
jgi:AbrB family looped-hinge helix DNA binding protein